MNLLWNSLGILSLALGVLGIFLPVLPTTPFVILAAFLFSKGSPRLRHWLVTNKTFGPMIVDWEERGAIPTRAKVLACIMMLAVFTVSIVLGLKWWVLLIQAISLTGAATFILTRPSN